jgi:hypothetical protein
MLVSVGEFCPFIGVELFIGAFLISLKSGLNETSEFCFKSALIITNMETYIKDCKSSHIYGFMPFFLLYHSLRQLTKNRIGVKIGLNGGDFAAIPFVIFLTFDCVFDCCSRNF